MYIHEQEFPFEEYRTLTGDYFDTIEDVLDEGFDLDQVWSIVISDGEDSSSYVYGPPHHLINVVGYIATQERHDHSTYYAEIVELDDD